MRFRTALVSFLAGAGLALVAAGAVYQRHAERTERERETRAWPSKSPSVILVILDTLRADRLGCYGYGRPTSPRLDAIAADAVLFENAYSQAPNTPPSIASILTSQYPVAHHFAGMRDRLSEGLLTIAESFRAAGYRTAAFVDAGLLRRQFGLDQGFDTYEDEPGGFEKILPRAARWLHDGPERPAFLLLHTYDVHTPYEETPGAVSISFLEKPYAGDLTSTDLEKFRSGNIARTLTAEETRHFSDLYDGGIAHVDAMLGEFVDDLAKRGVLDRAIVAITSDHGEEFMEHGSVLHDKLYRTVTHVPLLIRLPGREYAGRRIEPVVELIDLAPTLLAAAGVPSHAGMQGRSLLALVRGEPFENPQAVGQVPWNKQQMGYYRDGLHMISDARTGHVELFEVAKDPLEQRDLASARTGAVTQMKQKLASRLDAAASRSYLEPPSKRRPVKLDAKTEESLRALGYLE